MTKAQVALLTAVVTSAVWLLVGAVGVAGWLFFRSVVPAGGPSIGYEDVFAMEAPDFAIEAAYPAVVSVGDEATVEVTVRNTGESVATVGSIDVYDSILDAFEVVGTDPPHAGTMEIFDFTTFSFGQTIDAGGEWTVTFTLRAKEAGDFEGDLDVCDPDENYVTEVLSIRVEP